MKKYFSLNVGGAILDSVQLEKHLEKLASNQILKKKSDKRTYPIPRLKENILFIWKTYLLLGDDIKNGIPTHPAGEWILDNYYLIDRAAKYVTKNLSIKDYTRLPGIMNGNYNGYSRAYVLASEIVSYTDGKIDGISIQKYLNAYQSKKNLSMEELWTIPTFLYIALIEKIRQISEKIYLSQMQKHKVEDIISRLIDLKKEKYVKNKYELKFLKNEQTKYPFIEYMSYKLKKYGKKTFGYIETLEEIVNKTGLTISECINREHFDIASKKISIGYCVSSISTLNRLNYAEIFNNINGVEEVLKKDPCEVYDKMDEKTKEYYRKQIERISKKTKLSEIYIAKKCLELSNISYSISGRKDKASHVGYYLISNGQKELYAAILNKNIKRNKAKKAYILTFFVPFVSVIFSCIAGYYIHKNNAGFLISLVTFLLLIIPIKNILIKVIQYISGIFVSPKLIPKMDFSGGVPEEYSTMVVIPTILNSKDKIIEMVKKLEVYYIANKSDNLYFTLLGDCTSEKSEKMDFDEDIIKAGKECINNLNKKYPAEKYPRFNFIYRKRTWNKSEECFLGWERKRGALSQLNDYLLGKSENVFLYNSFEEIGKLARIKYVITLDSDTNLVLNTAFELIGAMAHILNTPIIDKEKNIVCDGYGIITPRVGVGLEESNKSLFSMIFSGLPGTDAYTNTVSDFYQDNFDEGIYTGKGIYDLEVFYNVLNGEIPENKVLSHDLLEGCFLKCGFASDILLMDGFPTSYGSYRDRLSRWIRGDVQIIRWIFSRRLNMLSKYKILDNISRSMLEGSVAVLILISILLKSNLILETALVSISMPYLIELFSKILNRKNGEIVQKKFSKNIGNNASSICKILIEIVMLLDKAVFSISSQIKAFYRMTKSKKHLLEWTTSEDSEKKNRIGFFSMYKKMIISVIIALIILVISILKRKLAYIFLNLLFVMAPGILSILSKQRIKKKRIDLVSEESKKFINDIGYKTWAFFKDYLNDKTNYLPPDNYQEDRKNKIVYRTSPTNIGLALLSVISSYDLGYETKENTIYLLEKMIDSIDKLPKWYGHLYNWYNIKTLSPLYPRYISSVDSGNFVGYLYVAKEFILEEIDDQDKKDILVQIIDRIISNTDFSKLFDSSNGLFSIGYNIEENKLTDSYYDLMASESRQTSLVAIAKKDVPAKHWKNLGRTLTILNRYKGLISWSGTSFEYLMPPVIIKKYEGSLLDESCKFMIMSQIEYAKKLGITWGISEAAFNLRDFNGDYQYKAFGIPWLGLKRGLADEMVVSSYGTILAINDYPNLVLENLKQLKKAGMYNKYGFYESIDYTPSRVKHGKVYSCVKTYMAHHQGLILLSINNLINNNILQKRFSNNPEIQAVDILLQERMPDNVIITKDKKEKPKKIKYEDYNYYSERRYTQKEEIINEFNLIGSSNYNILCDKCGKGISKYKKIAINRFKNTDYLDEGILFWVKDVNNKDIWSLTNLKQDLNKGKCVVSFYSDKSNYFKIYQDVKSELNILVAPEDSVEIRNINLKNLGDQDKNLELSCYFEPVLAPIKQYESHKAFCKMFLSFEQEDNILIVKRKPRTSVDEEVYMAITMFDSNNLAMEFETNKKDCIRQK